MFGFYHRYFGGSGFVGHEAGVPWVAVALAQE